MILSNTHLRSVVDHDGAVILDLDRNTISPLNSTGAYVWERLRQGLLLNEIIDTLARETGADLSIVDHDVRAFFEELKLKHLLP
jgi:hypothetical protein